MGLRAGYKQTEVGVIPEDWEVFKLSDCFTIYAGGDVNKQDFSRDFSDNFPYPIYANALRNRGLYGFTSKFRSVGNAVTVTGRGMIGHAEYRSEPFFPIVRLLVLEPNGILDAGLTASLINERVKFSIESTGVPQLTAPQLGHYLVGAPPTKAEQTAIAEALSDVDALLAGLGRLIAKKRALKQAALHQLLTAKTRLPGFTGDWQVKRLGDVAAIRNKKVNTFGNDVAAFCVELEQIGQNTGQINDHSDARNRQSIKYRFQEGDVLFGRLRPYLRKFWRADRRGVCSTEIWPLIPIADRLVPNFLFQTVQTDAFIEAANSSYGTHMPRSDWKALTEFEFFVPNDPEEQTAIAAVLSDMDSEIAALERRLAKTRDLKQAMMQELLTGKTRLVTTKEQTHG